MMGGQDNVEVFTNEHHSNLTEVTALDLKTKPFATMKKRERGFKKRI
jgi:hypothetical protein